MCCEKWNEATGHMLSVGPSAIGYGGSISNAQIECDETTHLWNVNGCCGGHCYVLQDLRFCPWCGADHGKED